MAGKIINDLKPGTLLHGSSVDYEIVRALGQGSFGITYLAKIQIRGSLGSRATSNFVAIKEFFMHEINERQEASVTGGSQAGVYGKYKEKFIKEAKNLAQFNNPFIINVMDLFESNNTVYYAMDYIEGGSLDEMIQNKGRLSEDEAIRICRQIAEALKYMHGRNMLHLDLKPSNIMMRSTGEIVLIDFGLSKQYDREGNPESSSTVGAGTPGYAPIEQSNYSGDNSKGMPYSMDIYALGATLYKLLTGRRPPVASDLIMGFPEEEMNAARVSQPMQKFIEHAMSVSPVNRIQNADSFLKEIDKLNVDENIIPTSHSEDEDEEGFDGTVYDGKVEVVSDNRRVNPQPVKPQPVKPQPVKPKPVKPQPPKPGPVQPKPTKPRRPTAPHNGKTSTKKGVGKELWIPLIVVGVALIAVLLYFLVIEPKGNSSYYYDDDDYDYEYYDDDYPTYAPLEEAVAEEDDDYYYDYEDDDDDEYDYIWDSIAY